MPNYPKTFRACFYAFVESDSIEYIRKMKIKRCVKSFDFTSQHFWIYSLLG